MSEVSFCQVVDVGGGRKAAEFEWVAPCYPRQFRLDAISLQTRIEKVSARGGDTSEEERALDTLQQEPA